MKDRKSSESYAGLNQQPVFSIRVHRSFNDVEMQWRALQRVANLYVFQTFEWLSAWQQQLGERQGWQPRLMEVFVDDEVVMLCPLGIRQERSGCVLGFLGGDVTDYNAPVMHPAIFSDINQTVFQKLWDDVIAQVPEADIVRLHRMPLTLQGMRNPVTGLTGMLQTEQAHAVSLPETYADFQRTRSKQLFTNTRGKLRKLSQFGEVVCKVVEAPEERKQFIDNLARNKSRRWKETGSRDLFAEPGYLSFYKALAESGIEDGEILLIGLQVGEQWIAMRWAIRLGQRVYSVLSAFEGGQWRKFAPGRVLLNGTIEWCIAKHWDVFDLTVGDEAYKLQWTDQVMPMYSGSYGVTARGKIMVYMQRCYRQMYAAARNIGWLQSLVRRLRGKPAPASDQ
jgi:CelD/BcsL family acetyltransferase involved in cellulose biosynthesis